MSDRVTFLKESSKGLMEISADSYHLSHHRIFLDGTIDSEMANRFRSQLLFLEEENLPVTIYINSSGGEVNAGLMIYDFIQNAKIPLKIVCTGKAYSMAAVLLACGKKGTRYIYPHSEVMIHEPLLAGGVTGSATSIKNTAESILKVRETLNSILAVHTGKSVEEVEKATSYDNFLSAKEAVEFGLCDMIGPEENDYGK